MRFEIFSSLFSFIFSSFFPSFPMGLAEPSPPAPLAHTNKMSDAEDAVASSPLPVSSCGAAVLSPAEKEAGSSGGDGVSLDAAAAAVDDDDDAVRFRGRDLPPVGQDPLAAAAAKISETAHRAAELTLGAVMPPGTTTEDLVRASTEGLWSALSAARGLAAGAVAAAAQASDAAVEGTRQQYHAVVEAAKEAVAANNSSLSSDALESFRPEDGSAVLGAFHAELNDLVSSSSSLFPPAPRRIRGALFVTSSSVLFLVSRAHQALGRAVSRAVTASAAEASSASLGTASSELGGFLGAALAAEDAERAAREAEEAAGLPAAGTVAAIPLGAIGRVEVVVAGAGDGGSGGDGDGVGRNALVVFLKEGCSGNEGSSSVTFSGFGAPSDADEALALVEHLLGEGKEGEEEAEEKK